MIAEILIAVIILTIFYYFLVDRERRNLQKLKDNYDESENRSKGTSFRRIDEVTEGEYLIAGLDEPKRQELLPTADIDFDGEDSDSIGEDDKDRQDTEK